jgi:hypothetical protein
MPKLTTNLDHKWPSLRDRLLRSKNGKGHVVFSNHSGRYAQIWMGYMQAGDKLIDAFMDETNSASGELIYPILFCYRHAIEMALKWMISRYGNESPKADHNLWQQWRVVLEMIGGVGHDTDDGVQAAGRIIKQMYDADRSSESFRYAVNKNRVLIRLPNGPIDLKNLKDVMEGLSNFFDGLDAGLEEMNSYNDEY